MNLHPKTQAMLADMQRTEKALDSANAGVTEADASKAAFEYAQRNVAMQAVSAVNVWCEGDEYSDGEGSADRLFSLMVGVADIDKDGELSEDENTIVEQACSAAWDYMASKGVADEDLEALLNSDDADAANAAGDRVCEFLAGVLPEGEDASMDDVDSFVFGKEALEPALDAVYKMKFAIRDGKKMRIKKRVAGHVRLTAKQKIAVMKMHRKSHSAAANMHRAKSFKVRGRMGLK